nr:immunoglobulin heavy chain junction region [Mus musculus]
ISVQEGGGNGPLT